MTGVLIRDTDTRRERSQVTMEAKILVMPLKPRNTWGYQELENARKDPSLEVLETARPIPCLQNHENKYLLFLATQFVVLCYGSPNGLSQLLFLVFLMNFIKKDIEIKCFFQSL